MTNFFSSIKGLLQHDYGGTYLSIILKEIIEEDNAIVNDLLCCNNNIKKDTFYIQREWQFTDRNRRADLAVINKDTNQIIALIEIKYEDEKQSKTSAQLDDYLEYCNDNNICFTYLTKNLPPSNDLAKVGKSFLSYSGLVHRLEKRSNKKHLTLMLCKFLREEGYVFQKNIDDKALLALMINSLSFPNKHGLGRKLNTLTRITKDVPKVFEVVLNNTSVLGERFYDHIAEGVFKTKPIIEYKFTPDFSINKIDKRLVKLKNEGVSILSIQNNDIESGTFWSYSNYAFPGNASYLCLSLGYVFELEVNDKSESPIKCSLFAEVGGTNVKTVFRSRKNKIDLIEDQAYKKLLDLSSSALVAVIKNKDNSISRKRIAMINSMVSHLSKILK